MNTTPPVVLIHGMWSTPDALVDVKDAFEDQGYRVHTPRLPLHYPRNELNAVKRKALARSSVQNYVASLSQLIETLDEPPIIVGHSMGGLLAQLIAAKYKCNKLVLISSAAPAGINGWSWSVMRTFGHNLFKFPLWRSTTNLLLKNICYGIANSQTAFVRQDIIQKCTFESGWASMQISMWLLFRKPATTVNYQNINCPVLIIGGTADKITPIKIQRKIAMKYSGRATLKVLPGACHWTIGGSYFPEIKRTIFGWLHADKQPVSANN